MESTAFELIIIVAILANTITLCLEDFRERIGEEA